MAKSGLRILDSENHSVTEGGGGGGESRGAKSGLRILDSENQSPTLKIKKTLERKRSSGNLLLVFRVLSFSCFVSCDPPLLALVIVVAALVFRCWKTSHVVGGCSTCVVGAALVFLVHGDCPCPLVDGALWTMKKQNIEVCIVKRGQTLVLQTFGFW